MGCLKFENISAYLDSELEDKEKSSVESHLKSCVSCAAALEEMRTMQTLFKGAERHDAPLGFSSRVLARTAEQERRKASLFFPLSTKFAEAAMLVIVITVGIITGRAMTTSPSAEQAANLTSSLSLDLFEPTPPGSLGGAYLAMTEAGNEK